jgi:hypothetical protein
MSVKCTGCIISPVRETEPQSSYLVLVGTKAEVLDRLTSVLGPSEKEGVGASRRAHRKLVESDGLATSLLDPRAGSRGEAQGRDGELGDLQQAVVISDRADDHDGLAFAGLGALLVGSDADDARDGDGWAVYAGHKQAAEDGLVESRVGTAW